MNNPKALAYGENRFRACHTVYASVHAEHNAIMNLQPLPKKHHYKKVDMIVIRTTKTGVLGMSKPCFHCVLKMMQLPQEKGYRICRVIFTNSNGSFEQTTLEKLLTESEPHLSSFFRNTNFRVKQVS